MKVLKEENITAKSIKHEKKRENQVKSGKAV